MDLSYSRQGTADLVMYKKLNGWFLNTLQFIDFLHSAPTSCVFTKFKARQIPRERCSAVPVAAEKMHLCIASYEAPHAHGKI